MTDTKCKYESVLVVSTKAGDEAAAATVAKFKDMISSGAALEAADEWGKRRLAYPINKETEGFYVLFTFESDAEFPAELDRVYNITDGVLRSLIVKKED